MVDLSSFERVMKTVNDLCKKVRNGKYFVHEGILNWSSYDYEKPGISIQFDDGSFLRDINEMTISLEFGAKTPAGPNGQVDRTMQREMMEDSIWVFGMLIQAHDTNGDEIVHKVDTRTDRILAWHDTTRSTQGIVAQVNLDY